MKKSGFIEGSIIATIAIILVKFIGMIYVIPFYAIVGVQGSALYAYAYNIYVMFLDISTAGIPNAISKLVNEFDTLKKKEAKVRTVKIGVVLISFLSIISFLVLFVFSSFIATLIIGDIKGGNTVSDISFVIRCVAFSVLVIPILSVLRGYLQGHKIINIPSVSQIIEQLLRVFTILMGSFLLIKIFHWPLRYGIGLAIFGAFIGGLASLLYVVIKCYKNKKALDLNFRPEKIDNETNKAIIKKIFKYAVPMVIVSVSVSIYNFINMVLILKFTNYYGYSALSSEFIASAISTWSNKILMIVTSIGSGLIVSLIPNLVQANTLNNNKELNHNFNKALQIVLVVCIPMVVGISILAKPIWTVFYGYNQIGVNILAFSIFTALFLNLFMVTNFTLQSLNKFKMVYLSALCGYISNIILDCLFMILFHYIKIPIYYGALLATVCGYSISIIMALIYLKKNYAFKYRDTLNILVKTFIPLLVLVVIAFSLNKGITFNLNSRLLQVLKIVLISTLSAIIYIFILIKKRIIYAVFGKEILLKIKAKLFKLMHKNS